MFEDRFIKLVQDNDGFEFYQAFQNDFHLRYVYVGDEVELP